MTSIHKVLTEIRGDDLRRGYTVSVRALCEFAAKRGDLDLRFTPSPTAQEGVAGHQAVAALRPNTYRREVTLTGTHRHLLVRGRADGYDAEQQQLEEIKTFKGDLLERMPDNHRALHWAQAMVYGALICRQEGLPRLTICLVYFDVVKQRELPPLSRHCAASELETLFQGLCERFLGWAESELRHREKRDSFLEALVFPHHSFRTGQRELAIGVFRAARLGRCLMAQAPTGIGKTVATLFAMLKACGPHKLDKIFFLTAKGSGRALAFDALNALRHSDDGKHVRVLELIARDKACEHPDKSCNGESCPLARGFYDRLPAAREAAVEAEILDRQTLRALASTHAVCPYYLGQEMARWCDVIVGDYNHYFDDSAMLHALTLANSWRVAVLVDEAHNLVDRARSMYSANLSSLQLRSVQRAAPPSLKKPLQRLRRHWSRIVTAQGGNYAVLDRVPRPFASALNDVAGAIAEQLSETPSIVEPALLELCFDILHFARLIESFGTHSIFDVTVSQLGLPRSSGSACTLSVRNVVPAHFLRPRFGTARTTVLFSATLAPWNFYADILGLPSDVACLDVPGPFTPDQLSVHIVRDISTRYHDRQASLVPIAAVIAKQFDQHPGNYLAFFSSYGYLAQAANELSRAFPEIPVWQQCQRMTPSEQARFLSRFVSDGRGVGFAVLGGMFSEGIDLVGTRLVGVFIATLGLPQFNATNEEVRRRLQVLFGDGYAYTYLFPGIRKVVQAAGRVLRTPSDRGSVTLIDDRFGNPEVLGLLPQWWTV